MLPSHLEDTNFDWKRHSSHLYWVQWDYDGDKSELHIRSFSVIEEEIEEDRSDVTNDIDADASGAESHSESDASGIDMTPNSPSSNPITGLALRNPAGSIAPSLPPGVVEVGPKIGKVRWEKIDDINVDNRDTAKDQPRLLGMDTEFEFIRP